MNFSTKRKLFRGISLMLCIIMMMQLTQLFVFAVDVLPPDAENTPEATLPADSPSENPFELGEGELPYAQLQELSPLDVALPETITRAQAIEKGHVNRLYAQEKNMQSVLYQNQNGTKTAYVFDKPVKYVDADGNIKDKNTTIAATGIAGYAYAMTENSFSAYFGSTAANGVMIQYEDYAFSMKPETSLLVSTPTLGEDAKTVVYNGAFGAQTALRYETQLSGVKEDIILMRNVGKYAFNFLLTTSGLTPVKKENGAWILVNADQETVINFGSIVIKDSAGKTVYGTLNITPRAVGGYIMTVTVPQAFLQASDTTYPVYVDPSITTYEEFGSWVAISDFGIYNHQQSYNYGNNIEQRHFLNASRGKVIYKLHDFYKSAGDFTELEEYQIGNVTFNVICDTTTTTTFTARPMLEACDETSHVYLDSALFSTTASSPENSSSATKSTTALGTLSLDITEIARGWARYNEGSSNEEYDNPKNGFVLSVSATSDVYLRSTEAAGTNNMYYTIEYSPVRGIYYMVNKAASGSLKVNDNRAVSHSSGVNYQSSWIVKYEGSGKYLFMPMYHSGYALNSSGTISALPTTITNGYYWTLQMDSNQYEMFKNYSTGKVLCAANGTVSVVTERAESSSNYAQTAWSMRRYNFGNQSFVEITDPGTLSATYCHGYALKFYNSVTGGSNSDNSLWWNNGRYYLDSIMGSNSLSPNYVEETEQLATITNDCFNLWLNTYDRVEDKYLENGFNHNGEDNNLASNQYRVVVRVGIEDNNINGLDGDYHFWYQTKDGRWAHKNGRKEPLLLPYGDTPFTNESIGWKKGDSTPFYDSTIYCYVITVRY